MTKTLERPLNDCDCSAEQITTLTNAEPPKRNVFFFTQLVEGKHRRRASGAGESAAK